MKARSVPALRVTSYCSGVSCSRHSCSDFSIFVAIFLLSSLATKGTPTSLRAGDARPSCGHDGRRSRSWRRRRARGAGGRLRRRGAARALIAPASACPTRPSSTARRRAGAGDALHDQLRPRARGLTALAARRARPRRRRKSADILRCDEFSHEACGREFTYWIERFGYRGCWRAARTSPGGRRLGSVRSIFRAWMHSPGHRENILGPYARSASASASGPRLDPGLRRPVWPGVRRHAAEPVAGSA